MSTLDFQRQQFELTAHLRDPKNAAAPGEIEDRRLAIYRELLYNNVESFLSSNFPVIRKLLDDKHWHQLVRSFFVSHRSESPYFIDIPKEFLVYLQQERGPVDTDPSFLLELAHYEWSEVDVQTDQNQLDQYVPINQRDDLLTKGFVINPTVRVLAYRYPVHRIGPDFQPDTPGEQATFLLIYRRLDDKVVFVESNALTAQLLELLQTQPEQSPADSLRQLCEQAEIKLTDQLIQHTNETFASLAEQQIILMRNKS